VIRDLRRARRDDWAEVIFVGSADGEATRRFFADFAPEEHCIADPDGVLWQAFGLGRGGMLQLFGPAVFANALGAMLKGNGIGVPSGDPLRLGGFFLLSEGRIAWAWRARHAGDHPSLEVLETVARRRPATP
jgi:hypothetical protein